MATSPSMPGFASHPEFTSASTSTLTPAPPRRAHRRRNSRPAWWQFAAACVVAFGAGSILQPWTPGSPAEESGPQLTRDLFASHWRALAATSPVDVVSSDHHTVKPWFAGKIAESPPVQDFATQGFALIGGRIDYVGSQRVAVLAYRHGQHLIDVYVLPQVAPGTVVAHAQSQGYSAGAVMLGTEQAVVVTDMDAGEVAKFARLLGVGH